MGLGMGLFWCVILAAPAPEIVEAAAQKVLASDDYQTELPADVDGAAPAPGGDPTSARRDVRPDRGSSWGAGLQPLAVILWWVLVGVLALFALGWITREWSERRRGAKIAAPAAGPAPAARRGPAPELPDADALARAGDHAGAVHACLLAALWRMRTRLPAAWTSREILGRIELGDAARDALAGLVRLVEQTHFGGAPATEEHFREACAYRDAIGDAA